MLQSSSFEKKKKRKVKPLIIVHFRPNLHKKGVRMQGCGGVGVSPPTSQFIPHPTPYHYLENPGMDHAQNENNFFFRKNKNRS